MANNNHKCDVERADTPEGENNQCDWPGCKDDGEHRAPRSRDNIKSYHWFCIIHVRAYNKSWNYYAGMSEDEVENDVREDTVWQRPSWPMGGPMGGVKLAYAFDPHVAFDDFGLDGRQKKQSSKPKMVTPEGKAMAVLDLLAPVTISVVKARYKELVKRHHPDANGGDKQAEEKFKQISQAYETVMACLEI